uniref:Uncharacterized protein n=1 Tax=Mustela putorius furo TaxID=9669 RepID=M3Y7R0_MUSPF
MRSKERVLVSSRTFSLTWKEARAVERAVSSALRRSRESCSLRSSLRPMACSSSRRRESSSLSTFSLLARWARSFSNRLWPTRLAFCCTASSAACVACCSRRSPARASASRCAWCSRPLRSATSLARRPCSSSRRARSRSTSQRQPDKGTQGLA